MVAKETAIVPIYILQLCSLTQLNTKENIIGLIPNESTIIIIIRETGRGLLGPRQHFGKRKMHHNRP